MTYQAPVDDILAALKSTGALDAGVMNIGDLAGAA
jgi:hypothetical protein